MFVRFDDVISGRAVNALNRFSGVTLTTEHVDAGIPRQERDATLPPKLARVWKRLNAEAERDLLSNAPPLPA